MITAVAVAVAVAVAIAVRSAAVRSAAVRSAIVATTPTTAVAHAILTPIPRAEATVAIRAESKGAGGLHRQNGSTSDQRSGESLRY